MALKLHNKKRDGGRLGWAIIVLKRLIAFFLILFALRYWAMLAGFWPGEGLQFDTLPIHWQIAAPLMAVMLPISAVGLWGLFSWGTIAWLLTAGGELTMFWIMADRFGFDQRVIAFHLTSLAIYVLIKAFSRVLKQRDHRLAEH